MWLNTVKVGSPTSSFGESECKIKYFHGKVAHIHHNNIPVTHVSGGDGVISGYGGYVGGYTNPITSRTEIKTDFKMWVRSDKDQDYSIHLDWAPDIGLGQKITLMFLNDEFVAYVNHNTQSWCYMKSDPEIAKMIGQSGYLLENGDKIKASEDINESGAPAGALCATIAFFTTLAVQWTEFWGWNWIETPSNALWYLLPAFFLLGGLVGHGKKRPFWNSLVVISVIGFGSLLLGWQEWGAIGVMIMFFSLLIKPKEQYAHYTNNHALDTIKAAIKTNANYALNHF